MTYSTPLGSVTSGLILMSNSGSVSGFSGTAAGQYVISTGANTYLTTSNAPQSPATGVVQEVTFPITPVSAPAVGTQTTVYNASSLLCTATIQPLYSNSIFSLEWFITCITKSANVYVNAYEFTGPSPIGFSEVTYSNSPVCYIPTSGALIGAWSYTTPLTFSLCAFASTTAQASVSFSGSSDFCMITEYNATGIVPTAVTVTSTSATPVTLFTVVGAASTSVYIFGTVYYFDSVQTAGSAQTFQLVLQTPSSGSSTLAFSNVAGNSLALSPSLSTSISTNTLTVSVIGIAGKTFECKASYSTVIA
jgi:hypothetical protein